MIIRFCNRCGEKEGKTLITLQIWIYSKDPIDGSSIPSPQNGNITYLCEDCYQDFIKWLKINEKTINKK